MPSSQFCELLYFEYSVYYFSLSYAKMPTVQTNWLDLYFKNVMSRQFMKSVTLELLMEEK